MVELVLSFGGFLGLDDFFSLREGSKLDCGISKGETDTMSFEAEALFPWADSGFFG